MTSPIHLVLNCFCFKKQPDEPSWWLSFKNFFTTKFTLMLLFIPVAFVSHYLHLNALVVFAFNLLALIPLAFFLGDATEQISIRLGEDKAGLLNAFFGNAGELIIGAVSLFKDEIGLVHQSMTGSMLSNLLLVLGTSLLAGGIRKIHCDGKINAIGAQMNSTVLIMAFLTLGVPAAISATTSTSSGDILLLSRIYAILLLFIYFVFLFFQTKSHPQDFTLHYERIQEQTDPIHVDEAQQEDLEAPPQSVQPTEQMSGVQQTIISHQEVGATDVNEDDEKTKLTMNFHAAVVALAVATLVTGFCADFLVSSIQVTVTHYHAPQPFIGVILLAVVGNVPEHMTAVRMAWKGKYELAIAICIGSSIQIIEFVTPCLVLLGWMSNHSLSLQFPAFEVILLFSAALLVTLILMDGKTNYMEGLLLTVFYIFIAIAFCMVKMDTN